MQYGKFGYVFKTLIAISKVNCSFTLKLVLMPIWWGGYSLAVLMAVLGKLAVALQCWWQYYEYTHLWLYRAAGSVSSCLWLCSVEGSIMNIPSWLQLYCAAGSVASWLYSVDGNIMNIPSCLQLYCAAGSEASWLPAQYMARHLKWLYCLQLYASFGGKFTETADIDAALFRCQLTVGWYVFVIINLGSVIRLPQNLYITFLTILLKNSFVQFVVKTFFFFFGISRFSSFFFSPPSPVAQRACDATERR